jgi:hypothetical protein
MTVIAGWWTKSSGIIAADRGTEKNGKPCRLNRPKIRAIPRSDGGHVLFGFTGYGHHALFWDDIPTVELIDISGIRIDFKRWWHRRLDDFGTWLRERGDGMTDDGVWSAPWHGICVAREGLFELFPQGDLELVSPRESAADGETYTAVGSGCDVANGALYVASRMSFPPQDRLRLAVEAANAEAVGCGFGVDMLVEQWSSM